MDKYPYQPGQYPGHGWGEYILSLPMGTNNLTQQGVWDYTGCTGNPPLRLFRLQSAKSEQRIPLQCGVGYFIKVQVNRNVTVIIPTDNTKHSRFDVSNGYRVAENRKGSRDDAPPAPPGGPLRNSAPILDIKANGQDGPVDIRCRRPGFHNHNP